MYNFFVGIDISKNHFNVSILDTQGNTVDTFKLYQNLDDFLKLSSRLLHLSDPQNIAIGIESSGNYHINLLSFLISHNFTVVLINPILIYNFRKSTSLRKTKTDKIDANIIAKFLLRYPEAIKKFSPDDSLRLLARERENLAKDIARLKTQIRQIVFNIFKELGDHYNILTKGWLNFLLYIPSARVAREKGVDGIREVIEEVNEGRGRRIRVTAFQILEIARKTISIDDEDREIVLRSKIRRLRYLEEEMRELTRELLERVEIFRSREMRVLRSIPGIGEVSAAVFIAEVGDMRRFGGSYKRLVAYAGFDPVIYESGGYRRRLRISKRGSPHLRRIIWSMGIGVIKYTRVFREYYYRKREEGKSYKRAVIAVINKLLRLIMYLVEREETYEVVTGLTAPNYS